MDATIGTPAYVGAWLQHKAEEYLEDLQALDCFEAQEKWVALLYCVSARPLYLQRLLDPEVGQDGFEKFDVAVPRKVLDIAGVEDEQLRADLMSRVDCLRGQPGYLSGGTMQHAGWSSKRVRAT